MWAIIPPLLGLTILVQQVQCAIKQLFSSFAKNELNSVEFILKLQVKIYKHSDGNDRKHLLFCT